MTTKAKLIKDIKTFINKNKPFTYQGHQVEFEHGFLEVGAGWYPIIQKCLQELIDAGWDKDIDQIKSKFGTLRFYISSSDPKFSSIISNAEQLSAQTCETCSAPGKAMGEGWVVTSCDACHEKQMRKRKND